VSRQGAGRLLKVPSIHPLLNRHAPHDLTIRRQISSSRNTNKPASLTLTRATNNNPGHSGRLLRPRTIHHHAGRLSEHRPVRTIHRLVHVHQNPSTRLVTVHANAGLVQLRENTISDRMKPD